MAFYEILVRGKEDGTISGIHVVDYTLDGKTTSPRPASPEDFKGILGLQNASLLAQISNLQDEKALVESLKSQIRSLKGIPEFKPSALLALLTVDDLESIMSASGTPQIISLYYKLQNRAATTNDPIPIDSPTFLEGLGYLQTVLGNDRVNELFEGVNIDIVEGAYINV